MSDLSGLSGYAPTPGVIYGTANPDQDSDPYKRATLQEESFELKLEIKEQLLEHRYGP